MPWLAGDGAEGVKESAPAGGLSQGKLEFSGRPPGVAASSGAPGLDLPLDTPDLLAPGVPVRSPRGEEGEQGQGAPGNRVVAGSDVSAVRWGEPAQLGSFRSKFCFLSFSSGYNPLWKECIVVSYPAGGGGLRGKLVKSPPGPCQSPCSSEG